jgi:DNA-binding CsgD family transcriptional regulator
MDQMGMARAHLFVRRPPADHAGVTPTTSVEAAFERLTPRERRITLLLAEGLSTSVVAEVIGASPQSVTNARSSIRRKLSAPRGVQLSAFLRVQLERGHLQTVAQHVRALHDVLLTSLRRDLPMAS